MMQCEGNPCRGDANGLCYRAKLTDWITYQLFLLHAFHEDDEEVLGLSATVGECLLYGDQKLIPQGFVDDTDGK